MTKAIRLYEIWRIACIIKRALFSKKKQKIMYAILLFNDELDLKSGMDDLIDIFACHPVSGDLLIFESVDEADSFRERNSIDSQIIELPTYQNQIIKNEL